MDISQNLETVREKIRKSALKIHKNPDDVKLIAVTKGFDSSVIKEAIRVGIKDVGETKIQETRGQLKCLQKACFQQEKK